MQFGILGPLEVRTAAGEPVAVGGPRPRALLVLLLCAADRVVEVETLIAGQYGDAPPPGAANAVQAQVSRLRRFLPDGAVEFHGGGYRLAVDPADVDAHRFELLAGDGRRLLAAGSAERAAAVLREGLALWRGRALADLPRGHERAVHLDELRLAATEDLIAAELALPGGTSVAELRGLVAAHPLRERLRAHLVRALHAAGRRAEALTAFEDARRCLADELGTDPSPELSAAHLDVLRAEPPAPPGRTGMPAALTSFVGRDTELGLLAGLRGTRLVTVVGPGGAGKTRLATRFAAAEPGACFVDLSTVDDGDQVAHAVLAALGLRDSGFAPPSADPAARVVAALADDPPLLVLDNCEHVVAAAAALAATALAACPDLRVLATSREPLGLTGEALVPLGPLDAPSAAALFTARARAVVPGFTTDTTDAAVADICAALDGLPLAIELAAARLRQFAVPEIAARLTGSGRFRLLSRGERTAAARHRTLTAVVAWSWDLLEPAQRRLARRFAVFTGGAPASAVAAVCTDTDHADQADRADSADHADRAEVEDGLADLVDKSLVDTDGARYRMPETVRLFCLDRLAEAGEEHPVRARHAAHHLAFAVRADRHLRGAEQLDWLAALAAEHDNLLAALRWSAHGDVPTGLRLLSALAAYGWLAGRRGQLTAPAAELLAVAPDPLPDDLAEDYVCCVLHAGCPPSSRPWARAAELMRARDRPLRHPFGAVLWGMAAGLPEDPERAALLLADDPWNAALGSFSTALLAVLGGRPADGERELTRVCARFRALGERWGIAQSLDWLATVAGWRGAWSTAHRAWSEALALFDRLGTVEEAADLLCHRAECLVRQGNPAEAAQCLDRAAGYLARDGRSPSGAIRCGRAELAWVRGEAAGHHLDGLPDDAPALITRGRVAAGDAGELFRAAARAAGHAAEFAAAVEGLATVAEPGRAALLLGAAVAIRGAAVAGDPWVAAAASRARGALGAAAFDAAYARGAALPDGEARGLATT